MLHSLHNFACPDLPVLSALQRQLDIFQGPGLLIPKDIHMSCELDSVWNFFEVLIVWWVNSVAIRMENV